MKYKLLNAVCYLTVAGIACSGTLLWAANRPQLSNLTSGDFDRQLEIPETSALVPQTPEMQKAVSYYAGMPFDIGERIRFVVTYMGVSGGIAEIIVRTPVRHPSGFATRVTGEVKSADWYRWAVDIHEGLESIFDAGTRPVQFYLNQMEGSFRQSKLLNFAGTNVKQITQRKNRDQKIEDFSISTEAKDAVGALYYLRQKIAQAGESDAPIQFPIFTNEKTWTAIARRVGTETKRVGKVDYDTDVYDLTTQFGGLMEQKGRMKLWMTRDSRRLPIYAEASIKFGQIKLHVAEWDQGYADGGRKRIFEPIRQ